MTSSTSLRRTIASLASRRQRIVNLFRGAAGWEEGLTALGHTALGIEIEPTAQATAQAAGHPGLTLDVAALDPLAFGPVWGLIASPPCQADSIAGKGLGRRLDRPRVVACARDLAAGHDTRAEHGAQCADARSLLSVEPLRWALALRPTWIALEQVPPVLELWQLFAELLSEHGYHCDVRILSAEQYGVPQTRRRAFLIANRHKKVALPAPTHRSYDPRHPGRIRNGEQRLLPWVSMGEALGWQPEAISHTNCFPSEGRPRGQERRASHPSRTLLSKASCWTVTHPKPCEGRGRPAHSRPEGLDSGQRNARLRPTSAPAPTMLASGLAKSKPAWVYRRPATTVAADPRVQPPGHKRNTADPPGRYADRAGRDAVRVTVEQASALQGLRADYPWHGSCKAQFTQIGNAVCPSVARVVLAAAIGIRGRS